MFFTLGAISFDTPSFTTLLLFIPYEFVACMLLIFFCFGFEFVADISFSTTEETLAEAFSKFGEVTEGNYCYCKP